MYSVSVLISECHQGVCGARFPLLACAVGHAASFAVNAALVASQYSGTARELFSCALPPIHQSTRSTRLDRPQLPFSSLLVWPHQESKDIEIRVQCFLCWRRVVSFSDREVVKPRKRCWQERGESLFLGLVHFIFCKKFFIKTKSFSSWAGLLIANNFPMNTFNFFSAVSAAGDGFACSPLRMRTRSIFDRSMQRPRGEYTVIALRYDRKPLPLIALPQQVVISAEIHQRNDNYSQ